VHEITSDAELRELLGAKAFLRSELWDPATWRPDDVLSRARIAHRLERRDERLEDIERYYGEQYTAALYPTATP
jgi:uncharacterized protein